MINTSQVNSFNSGSMKSFRENKVALVVPIHEPYFIYGVNLIYSSINSEYDLYFVFSDFIDKQKFESCIPANSPLSFSSLVMEGDFSRDDLNLILRNRVSPSVKKFFALEKISDKYDYIICVDAETVVLKKNGWLSSARKIIQNKKWFGGRVAPHMIGERAIVEKSFFELPSFSDSTEKEILNKLGDGLIYSWWWDLPVYDCRHVPGFMEWIGWKDRRKFLDKISWFTFDHITYQLYTVMFHGFNFCVVEGYLHSLEFSPSDAVEYVFDNIGGVSWVNAYAFSQNEEFYSSRGVLAFYHIDRAIFPDFNLGINWNLLR